MAVTITWCATTGGLQSGTRAVTLDGASVTSAFSWTDNGSNPAPGCGASATSVGVVTLSQGPHTLAASIWNDALDSQPGGATASYTYSARPWRGASA